MIDAEATVTYDDLVALLSQGIGQRKLYFASHPRVQERAADFASRLDALLRRDRRDFFFLGYAEDNLVHEGRFLVGPTILGRRVVEFLQSIDSGGILFRSGLESRELLELFEVATRIEGDDLDLQRAQDALRQRQVRHIQLSPAYRDPSWFGQFLYEGDESSAAPAISGQPDRMVPVYQGMFESVQDAHRLAAGDHELDIDGVRTVGERLIKAGDDGITDVMQLVRYPDYDTFTVGHSVRVASIAALVAQRAGMPPEVLVDLATAGLLHDVGKGKVPEEILYKPAALTEDERRLMEKHPVLGAQILLENASAGPMAIAAAWGHHLRYDRGGYPAMAKWGFASRVTALLKVCDVFEALTAVRPYKRAMSARRAYEIMLADRGAFDPGAFHALVTAMGLYPPGTGVVLSNGERGTVVAAGAELEKPVVRVTRDRFGAAVAGEDAIRDLSDPAPGLRVAGPAADPASPAEPMGAPRPGRCAHPHHEPPPAPVRRLLERGR